MKLKQDGTYYPLQKYSKFKLAFNDVFEVMESLFVAKHNLKNKCLICENEPQEITIYPCQHRCFGKKCFLGNQYAKYLACPHCFGVIQCLCVDKK